MNALRWLALMALPVAAAAAADGVEAGYDHWDYEVEGFVDNSGEVLDFQDDLTVEARKQDALRLRWDTGEGWAPDLAAHYLRIDAGGRRVVSEGQSFGGIVLQPASVVLADADLADFDLVLRYPWRGEKAAAWGGVTIKRIDGDVTVRNETDSQETTQAIAETFPMLHLFGELALGARVRVSGGVDWASWQDDEAHELRAQLAVDVWKALGVSAGWQRKRYRLSSGDYRFDATLDGALLGAQLRF